MNRLCVLPSSSAAVIKLSAAMLYFIGAYEDCLSVSGSHQGTPQRDREAEANSKMPSRSLFLTLVTVAVANPIWSV